MTAVFARHEFEAIISFTGLKCYFSSFLSYLSKLSLVTGQVAKITFGLDTYQVALAPSAAYSALADAFAGKHERFNRAKCSLGAPFCMVDLSDQTGQEKAVM
jgi:hypothetical protein